MSSKCKMPYAALVLLWPFPWWPVQFSPKTGGTPPWNCSWRRPCSRNFRGCGCADWCSWAPQPGTRWELQSYNSVCFYKLTFLPMHLHEALSSTRPVWKPCRLGICQSASLAPYCLLGQNLGNLGELGELCEFARFRHGLRLRKKIRNQNIEVKNKNIHIFLLLSNWARTKLLFWNLYYKTFLLRTIKSLNYFVFLGLVKKLWKLNYLQKRWAVYRVI